MAKDNDSTAPVSATPAISIIIPLYNAEKYIGEALESILVQTFQNFEVIVVDDCSTDSSCEVVESYIPKFNDRLSLYHMIKNSGSAPAPRNNGFLISRGEYIFFMDSDDTFTQTALEEMYNLAKEYDADVVYCEKYFMSTGVGQEFKDNIRLADNLIQSGGFVDEPTLVSDNLADRLEELFQRRFWVTPWQRFVSRKLLVENEITFPEIIGSDDVVWCLAVLCFSKKFLRVPNICYIRRMYDESFTKSSKKSPNKHIHQWMDITIRGLKFINNFIDRVDFFRDNPDYRYKLFAYLSLRHSFNSIYSVCKELPLGEIYDIFLKEFSKDNGEQNVLISFLCTTVFNFDKDLRDNQKQLKRADETAQKNKQRIEELEAEIKYLINENSRLKKESNSLTGIPSLLQFVPDDLSKLPKPIQPMDIKPSSVAISIVIPMYNAEEYIAECLDSLLIQTFQKFEVIVVDDCSTDNSIKIVEDYAPKFNGRLRIISTEENSGGGGYVPRNLGLSLANGEYVFFLDADDFLLGSALEILHDVALEHNVDVVYSSAYYGIRNPNDVYLYRDGLGKKLFEAGTEDEPTVIVDEPNKNLDMLILDRGFTCPWTKFIRRNFLFANKITFPEISKAGDHIWSINVYCHAKRVFRLPTPIYFYRRYNVTSISRVKRTVPEQISYWVSAFGEWLKTLHNFASKTEILNKNPIYCYEASKRDFEWLLTCLTEERKKSSDHNVYEILYREFIKSDYMADVAIPFFFSAINDEKKITYKDEQILRSIKPYITARIDVEFVTESDKSDFQILSVSDSQAEIIKPDWFQKEGIGYQIQSHAGSLEILAKASVNGQIHLKLRGMYIRDRDDRSKCIPYWIDYKKLTVNKKKIFNEITPAWHNKSYRYSAEVKARREITIKVDWLPHRSDI